MRLIYTAPLLSLIALGGCTTTTNPTTGVTTTTVGPLAQLAVGDAFTLVQGAANAWLAKNPTADAQVQALLKSMQAAFVAWSANPTLGTAEAQALSVAVNALGAYMLAHGIPI